MSLLAQLMSEARKAELGYGIHENCIIAEVSNEERKDKNQSVIERNGYTKIQKLDEKGEVIAEKEISWFNLKSDERTLDNFLVQLEQMTGIVKAICDENHINVWKRFFEKCLKDREIDTPEDHSPANINLLKEDLTLYLKNPKNCKSIMDDLSSAYAELLSEFTGAAKCPKVRVKLVYDSKGMYVQHPRFDVFVENASIDKEKSSLRMSKTEESYYQKSLQGPNTTPNVKSTAI